MAAFTDPMLDTATDLLYCTCSGAELEFKFDDGTTAQALVTEGVDKHEGAALRGVFAKNSKLEHFTVELNWGFDDLKFFCLLENGEVINTTDFAVYDPSARDLFGNGMLVTTSGTGAKLLAQ